MDFLAACVEPLERLKHPSDLTFHYRGLALAAAISPANRERNRSFASRIWRFGLDGSSAQLTEGPGADALPRYSPRDDRLAFASDRDLSGKMSLFLLESGSEAKQKARPLGETPGTIEDIRWTSDATGLVALAADRGLDAAATAGAVRLTWGDEEEPGVTSPFAARRRLYRIVLADARTTEIGPVDYSVWEFDQLNEDGAVAIVSADASERGWYHSRLARLDFAKGTLEILYEPAWQIQGPAVDPSGRHVGFLESWSSDRGLVAGEIRILELASRRVTTLAADQLANTTSIQWRDASSLWFAGWARLGAVHGVVRLDGTVEFLEHDDAVIGTSSFLASVAPAPVGAGLAAVRESVGAAPEIVHKGKPGEAWRRVSALNTAVERDLQSYPEVRAVTWPGAGGLAMEGLLLLPRSRGSGALPMIVDIHGGPSWTAKHAFNPGYALPHAAAGYAVFLPNYRGNVGWGQEFARLNIGDPGGREFEDILAGVDWCIDQGIALAGHIGVTGASYGGYLTAWAVATTDRFQAAVMVSGIANHWSSHYSCNHDFSQFIVGGPMSEGRFRALAMERSPLIRLRHPTTPTLILHGERDRCTPLGQAHEFYAGLMELGCPAELVVYPREGHGFQERIHRRDAWRRTIAWFDRHLRAT
jgi:dipeptidyl aminopeptidase/acylaminoacyl peptidase